MSPYKRKAKKMGRRAFLMGCAVWYIGFGLVRILQKLDGQIQGVAPWLVYVGGAMLILAGFFALFHLE